MTHQATTQPQSRARERSPLARVALGCGNFGGVGSAPELFGQGLDADRAAELMDAAWELGITHFDTADAYGGGRSELAIGAWIASRGVRPALTTKTCHPMTAGGDHGLAPARIERQLSLSLERLGVDHVELYLAHAYDPDVALADSLAAFGELVADGRIGAYGVSNVSVAQLDLALAVGEPAAVQNSYSLLARGDGAGVLARCAQRGLAYCAYGPLMGGWLAGRYTRAAAYPAGSRMTQRPEPYAALATDATFDALDALRALAQRRGTSMAGTALAWLLADDRVSQVIVGPSAVAHLDPVREARARPLADAERAELDAVFA